MRTILLIIVIIFIMPFSALAAGLAPWEFGMSKSEVSSFDKYGPYKDFSNGDNETYNGIYDGKAENIQFFYDKNGKLGRIGVYLYEGTNIEDAKETWKRAYDSLTKKYGKIDIPGVKIISGKVNLEVLSTTVTEQVSAGENVIMEPIKQPKEMFVSSKFWSKDFDGTTYYWVIILLDDPSIH